MINELSLVWQKHVVWNQVVPLPCFVLNLSNLIQSIEISTAVARRLNRRGLWKVSFLHETKEEQRWWHLKGRKKSTCSLSWCRYIFTTFVCNQTDFCHQLKKLRCTRTTKMTLAVWYQKTSLWWRYSYISDCIRRGYIFQGVRKTPETSWCPYFRTTHWLFSVKYLFEEANITLIFFFLRTTKYFWRTVPFMFNVRSFYLRFSEV